MENNKNKHSVIVGIFVLVGIIILIVTVFTLGGQKSTFERKFKVNAVFENVGGLKVGDNVWLSGVKVGVIKNIDFDKNASVLITMNIENKVKSIIHKDSKVKVSSDGLMGNRIIIIYGGTPGSPLITSNDSLFPEKVAGTNDLIETLETSSNNLITITGNLKDITNNILAGKGTLAMLLNDSTVPQDIKQTIAGLKRSASNFKTTSAQSEIMMQNLVDFSAKLQTPGTLVNDLVSDTVIFNDLKSGIAQLKKTIDTVSVFSYNIKKASDALNENNNPVSVLLYNDTVALHLKQLTANLDSASHKLNEDLEAIQHNFLFRGYFKKKQKQK